MAVVVPSMRRVVDLAHSIETGMPVFPTDPAPAVLPWARMPVHPFDTEVVHISSHTGTHMDAPSHFVRGAAAIDEVDLAGCLSPGALLDLRSLAPVGTIDPSDLRDAEARSVSCLSQGDAVLLWTGWSRRWRHRDYVAGYPGLSEDGARYLVERGASVVGIDTPNVDHPSAGDFPAHRALLSAGIPIVENLTRLGTIRSPNFTFVALPLAIVSATGSPVRAVAIIGG